MAFTAQKAASELAGQYGFGWATALALALPITVGLAALSWRLVERPALSLKNVLLARKPALADPRAETA